MPLIVAKRIEPNEHQRGNVAWWNWAALELSTGRIPQGPVYNCISAMTDPGRINQYRLNAADADLLLSWAKGSPFWPRDGQPMPEPLVRFDHVSLNQYLQPAVLMDALRRSGGRIWFYISGDQWAATIENPGNSGLGGDPIPLRTLDNGAIFTPKVAEVIKWLTSYGLSKEDAEEIVYRCPRKP